MTGEDMRFSDERLEAFYQQFKEHQRLFQLHVKKETDFMNRIADSSEANAKAISELTIAQKASVESMSDLLEAWRSAQAVVRVGSTLGKFVKWLTSLAIIGAGIKLWIDGL